MALLSKSKFLLFIIGVTFVLFTAQCGDADQTKQQDATAQKDTAACKKPPVNPNGDSELAVLMREMLHSADTMRANIKSGNPPGKFPEAFLKLHTAKPTDADTKHESFDAFATNYIDNLQILCRSSQVESVKNYNAVINTCLGCHNEHCPGPIKTIEKLFLKQ
jgi:hypothetical protein